MFIIGWQQRVNSDIYQDNRPDFGRKEFNPRSLMFQGEAVFICLNFNLGDSLHG